MNTNRISRNATALAFASLAALVSSCGSGSGGSSSTAGIAGVGGGGASTPGQCVLGLTQNVGFGATDVQISSTQIAASPEVGSAYTTTLTGGAYAAGYQYSNGWNTAASDAYVGMNITATGATTAGYPYGTSYGTSYGGASAYTVQGALTMTALRWQTIVLELEEKYPYGYQNTGTPYGTSPYGTSYPYGTTPSYGAGQIPSNICISEIAFDVLYGPGTLQGGEVVLLLNTGDSITLQL